MPRNFYNLKEYRELQSRITKENWKKGVFDFQYNREKRICTRDGCSKVFEVKMSNPKVYCSSSCAAIVNNVNRGARPEEVKSKIAEALKGRPNPRKGMSKFPLIKAVCSNPKCKKVFFRKGSTQPKFCSVSCVMKVIGRNPTSPKASRGKAGIRLDINKTTYFYSRWEANIARLFNHLSIKWIHEPKKFDLKTQTYTPDFYLPEYDIFIEVKNFLWKYSKIRDKKFRKIYPNIILIMLLKKEYLEIEEEFAEVIENWEYKNSPFIEDRALGGLMQETEDEENISLEEARKIINK
ncbi:MAG: hypothetical protein HQ539_00785 [Parcubacteria group bacterium]|nr:hypothetical protein [Parcubacteria group bacterium]